MSIFRSACLACDVDAFLADEDRRAARFPVCDRCGERIVQNAAFLSFSGSYLCDDCVEPEDDGFSVPL